MKPVKHVTAALIGNGSGSQGPALTIITLAVSLLHSWIVVAVVHVMRKGRAETS